MYEYGFFFQLQGLLCIKLYRGDKMNPCETSMTVAALANAISCKLSSPEEVAAVAAVFVQLGDTMAAIAAQQILCDSRRENSASP